jgi:predicted kinase
VTDLNHLFACNITDVSVILIFNVDVCNTSNIMLHNLCQYLTYMLTKIGRLISKFVLPHVEPKTLPAGCPTMIYVLGGIGSGKSTYIHNVISKTYPTYEKVIFDDIMVQLPSFKSHTGLVTSWPIEDRSQCYIDALNVTESKIRNIVTNRQSFVIEGTGMNLKSNIADMLHQRQLGYKLVIHHVHTFVEICLDRISIRNMQISRKVSMTAVYASHDLLTANLPEYRKIVDEFVTVTES